MFNRIILLSILMLSALILNGQAGTLDPSYADNAEIKYLNFLSSSEEVLTHSVTDSEDRTWIGGRTFEDGDWKLILSRLDANGNYDTDFGGTGHAVLNLLSDNTEEVRGMALQGDDLILATISQEEGIFSPYVLKYSAEGFLDTDFAESGIASPSVDLSVSDVKVDDEGNIFLTGTLADDNIAVMKFLPSGEIDETFGFFGATTLDLPSDDQSVSLDFDENGNIYVFGYGTLNGTTRAHISAFTADGLVNTDFTANGRKSITWSDNKNFFLSDGFYESENSHFYLVGRTAEEGSGSLNSAAVKVSIDAEQDMTFDGDGWLEIDLGIGADDLITSIEKGPGGYYLSANVSELPQGINSVVIHIDEMGNRVENFGNLGIATFNIAELGPDQALSLSFQSDGNLILTGIALAEEVGIFGYAARILTSDPLSVDETTRLEDLSIFPNPARDFIQVSDFKADRQTQTYRIISLQGQIVMEGNLNSSRININQLDQGTYILQVDGYSPVKWLKLY